MTLRGTAQRPVPADGAVHARAVGGAAPAAHDRLVRGRGGVAMEPRLRCGERGSVTAEMAVALPAVVLMIVLGVGALTAAAAHVRLQDAAADAARLVSRGDAEGRATDTVAAAVDGAGVEIAHEDDLVCVEASAPARIAGLVSITLTARSCALAGGL